MNCPRCGPTGHMAPEQGDLHCVICGHVEYGALPVPKPLAPPRPGPPATKPRKPCLQCGKPAWRPGGKFCGQPCSVAWRRDRMAGKGALP